jgi:signal transduction histidine kinase
MERAMKNRCLFACMALLQIAWFTSATAAQAGNTYALKETRQTVALVEAAAREIHARGESAFDKFRQPNSRWYQGDRYVFVWDLQGNRYVYPPDPAHEKQNLIGLEDVGGKPIGKMFIEMASSSDGKGWVHYQWNRPHDYLPLWKSTYIMRATAPSGQTYLVGSGVYEGGMEKAFLVEEVEAAADLLTRQGRQAFATLRDKKSRFFFHDTYVFVTSKTGIELVNPAFPSIEGRNLWDTTDSTGKYLVRDYIKVALDHGSGWVTYKWPRPGMPHVEATKTTYVKKVMVNGEPLIIGAGMYE